MTFSLNVASNSYEKKVKDYNFGSLIRTDCRAEYGETNTIFGTFTLAVRCNPTDYLSVTRIQVLE